MLRVRVNRQERMVRLSVSDFLQSRCAARAILMVTPFPLDGIKSGSKIRAEGVLRTLTSLGAKVDYVYLDSSGRGGGAKSGPVRSR